MLQRLDLRGRDLASGPSVLEDALARPQGDDAPLEAVREILSDVEKRGDEAVREFTARFDGCELDDLRVPADALSEALESVDDDVRAAFEFSRDQIEAYHRTQLEGSEPRRHRRSGVDIEERVIPVDRAGLYVPGGRAAYPSTVLMTAIPARVAGVEEVVLCVPPDRDGNVAKATMAAAALAGVDRVYRIGGAQAIAAMAYGTQSVPAVDVIVGPGNVYVALAKREVLGIVGIESMAGPSELVVIADDDTVPDEAAIDLIAQAEHGPDGAAVLVTWSESAADTITERVAALTAESPRQAEIEATMRSYGRAVLVDDASAAMTVANWVAPEHLQIMCADADALAAQVRNAGAVFCGRFAPAPVGDYVAGVNHVLPTGRTARFSSALRVDDFQKHVHIVRVDADGLAEVGRHAEAFAAVEGLDAHGRSIRMRGVT